LALRKAEVLEDRWNLPRSSAPRLKGWAKQFLENCHHKSTREGQLIPELEEFAASHTDPNVADFSTAVSDTNEVWKQVKNRDDPSATEVVAALAAISQVFHLLDRFVSRPAGKSA